MDTVKNVGQHPVDLSDGRQIGPGETADEVSLGNVHNKALVDDGHILVVGAYTEEVGPPPREKLEDEVEAAAPPRPKEGSRK
jgi:hypothetical protein